MGYGTKDNGSSIKILQGEVSPEAGRYLQRNLFCYHLSRLEQGSREVDSLLGQTLLGRIGKEVTLFETILSEQDYELWKMREQIEKFVENHKVKTVM